VADYPRVVAQRLLIPVENSPYRQQQFRRSAKTSTERDLSGPGVCGPVREKATDAFSFPGPPAMDRSREVRVPEGLGTRNAHMAVFSPPSGSCRPVG
jgi:hypothetical protein